MENQLGEESTSGKWKWDQVWECFRDPQVYFGFFNTFLACIPNGYVDIPHMYRSSELTVAFQRNHGVQQPSIRYIWI